LIFGKDTKNTRCRITDSSINVFGKTGYPHAKE
jgi:hypothetical protein